MIVKELYFRVLNSFKKGLLFFRGKVFKVGETVETSGGLSGKIIVVYRDQKTDKIVGCGVKWNGLFEGNEISIFIPQKDMRRGIKG